MGKHIQFGSPGSDTRIRLRAWETGDLLAYQEIFEQSIYDLDACQAPDLIVDIGAHIGLFSALARGIFPDSPILAFEPDKQNFKLLCSNATARITAQNAALSNYSGTCALSGQSSVSKRLQSKTEPNDGSEPRVEVLRASKAIPLSGVEKLILKMDVEGEEFRILEEILDLLPVDTLLFVEVHNGIESREEMKNLLEARGFEFAARDNRGGPCFDCRAGRGIYSEERASS